jgi:hypothetical protein
LFGKFVCDEPEWETSDDERRRFVEDYPIPNSREDFLEFFIFIMGHIATAPETKYEGTWNKIWQAKCRQIYTRARIAMSDEPDSLEYMKQLAAETGFSLTE